MTEFMIIGHHKLEIAWHGPGPQEAPTLVFLHEGLGSVDQWHDFPEKLSARYKYEKITH
jgi:hypothetical protein